MMTSWFSFLPLSFKYFKFSSECCPKQVAPAVSQSFPDTEFSCSYSDLPHSVSAFLQDYQVIQRTLNLRSAATGLLSWPMISNFIIQTFSEFRLVHVKEFMSFGHGVLFSPRFDLSRPLSFFLFL